MTDRKKYLLIGGGISLGAIILILISYNVFFGNGGSGTGTEPDPYQRQVAPEDTEVEELDDRAGERKDVLDVLNTKGKALDDAAGQLDNEKEVLDDGIEKDETFFGPVRDAVDLNDWLRKFGAGISSGGEPVPEQP